MNSQPTEERFVQHRAQRLREAETVRQHLSMCRECASFVLAARAFSVDEEQLPAAQPEEITANWQALIERLERYTSTTESSKPRVAVRKREGWLGSSFQGWTWWRAPALGFCTAMALLWLGGHAMSPRSSPTDLSARAEWDWATDFALHTVEPWGKVRGMSQVVEVRRGDVLMLFVESLPANEPLTLDIVGLTDGFHHQMTGLKSPGSGLLSLKLPQFFAGSGHHNLTLYLGDGDVSLSTYRIRVLPP